MNFCDANGALFVFLNEWHLKFGKLTEGIKMKPRNSFEELGRLYISFSSPLAIQRLSIDHSVVSTDRVREDMLGVIPDGGLSLREIMSIVKKVSAH